MSDAQLAIIIRTVDAATRDLAKIRGELDRMGLTGERAGKRAAAALEQMDKAARSLGSLGNKLTLAVTMPALGMGAALAKFGMDAVESENLFEVSMGAMANDARRWSEELRRQFGLNAYEIRRTLGTFNVMFQSMGLGEQAAYDMAKGLTQLSYDLASFYNLRPEDAFQKLQSAISGEVEPLRRLGIVVNDTTIQQWALARGLITAGQEMSEAQKVLARYYVIMEQTSKAQGDLARTMDSPANQLRRLQAEVTQLATDWGMQLMPVLSSGLTWLNNVGLPAVKKALQAMTRTWGEMSDEAKTRILLVAGLLVAGGPLLKGISVAIKALQFLGAAFSLLPGAAKRAVVAAIVAFVPLREQIGNMIEALAKMEEYRRGFGYVATELRQAAAWVKQPLTDIASDVAGFVLDKGFDVLNEKLGTLGTQVSDLIAPLSGADAWINDLRRQTNEAIDPTEQISNWWNQAAGSAGKLAKEAKDAGISLSDLTQALITNHPSVQAVAAEVAMWQQRIDSVNLAIQANQDQLKAAQAEYSRMSEQLSQLNEQLSAAKQRLSDLQNVQFVGEGAMGEQIYQLQRQILGLEIQKLKLPAGMDTATIDKQIEELRRQLDLLQKEQEYTFGDMRRQVQKAAEGVKQEMTLDEALSAVSRTKSEIDRLTGAVAAQEAAMKAQQNVINSIQAAGEALNRTLQQYQANLQEAQRKQDLLTQALQLAYNWLLNDRTKFTELGTEGERIAGVMDVKARELLAAVSGAAADTTTISSDTLATMVANYQRDMATALTEVGKVQAALDQIPRDIYTYVHTVMLPPEGGVGITPRQSGGPVYAGSAYLVGERGPELFVPYTSGQIVPNSRLAGSIDYDRLAAALARQPIVVQIDGHKVMTVVRDNWRQTGGRTGQRW